MTVLQLRALPKEHKLRGYSRLKKAELIAFLQANLRPRTRPPKPTRPPSPPPLMQYQLKPKRGKEPPAE